MDYRTLMFIHLYTIVPCIFLGAYGLLAKKGTPLHRSLGKIYMVLMLFTAVVTLFMPAYVGSRLFNHFGWIHLFSLLTLWSIPRAYFAIKKGNVRGHQISLICLYLGAIGIAGAFTLAPGRYLHGLFFG
ncbi:DUF2306 domain-containing protein [Croceivirga thetidis]|uniref:DUF2306 domain-containing protein n=1 Tax=Croceivirga thetidis TaxID=2721623 RepID=A0ABX1GQ29_9FLAO|nr:DUF2306 domain-containing protein [Croceivirga thetidis]NKI31065.1 DUF2306 domain-containing protein [Croceivirga thetidis]